MSTANNYEFNAPHFVDFNADLDESDGADTFFDVNETPTKLKDEDKENDQPEMVKIKKEINTLLVDTTIIKPNNIVESLKKEIKSESLPGDQNLEKPNSNKKRNEIMLKAVRRRSGMSKGIFPTAEVMPLSKIADNLSDDLSRVSLKPKKQTHFEGIPLNTTEVKQHTMMTRGDKVIKTPKLELRTRNVIKEDSVQENRKRKSEFGGPKTSSKYMALAEYVLRFQRDTPPRFHTSRRRSSGVHGGMLKARNSYNPRRTIAKTPKLMTLLRSRPVDIPTQQEKEELEVEEMKKYQVKAMPLNDKIFQPPKLPLKSERPSTVLEPFHLTEVFKKPLPKPEGGPFTFTAKPVPKVILKGTVGVAPKKELPITVPQSPAITKSTRHQRPVRVAAISNDFKQSTENLNSFGVPYTKFNQNKKTELKPFSFEERDKEMMEKKEKKIKEVYEAEKRAREFKANPAPTFTAPKEVNRSARYSSWDHSKSSAALNTSEVQPFKARSPRVLRKEPFKPKKEHIHSEPLNVQLYTERRAQERQEFEMKQLEKEEQIAYLKEQMELEKKEREEEELKKLRQEIVHKAQPMPKFKIPAKRPTSNIPLTTPKSPNFSKRTRSNALPSTSKSN